MSDDAGDPAVDIKDLTTYQHSERIYRWLTLFGKPINQPNESENAYIKKKLQRHRNVR